MLKISFAGIDWSDYKYNSMRRDRIISFIDAYLLGKFSNQYVYEYLIDIHSHNLCLLIHGINENDTMHEALTNTMHDEIMSIIKKHCLD